MARRGRGPRITTYRSVRFSDSSRAEKVGSRFLVFKALGMGGMSSPNNWCRFAAATGRVVSSVFGGRWRKP